MKTLDCGKAVESLYPQMTLDGDEYIHSMAFNRFNTELITAMLNMWMSWDIVNGLPLYIVPNRYYTSGIHYCCNDTNVLYTNQEGQLSVYSGHQMEDYHILYQRRFTSFALSPDKGTVAVGSHEWPLGYDKEVRIDLIDATSGTELKLLVNHVGTIISVSYSTDGSRLVSCCSDQTLIVWNVMEGVVLFSYNLFHNLSTWFLRPWQFNYWPLFVSDVFV
jgi:WD40 repeat protein